MAQESLHSIKAKKLNSLVLKLDLIKSHDSKLGHSEAGTALDRSQLESYQLDYGTCFINQFCCAYKL